MPLSNPQSEIPHPKSPLTDSPWFWVLVFSLMSLGALAAISGKYARRQTVIERKYQARQRVAERLAAENNSTDTQRTIDQAERRDFATPDSTLIPLWPLAAILILVALIAAVMIYRGRGRPGSSAQESAP